MGSYRRKAFWRIVAFIWSFVAAIVSSLLLIVAMIWGAVDVLWQLLTGREGLTADSGVGDILVRVIWWPVNLQVYAMFGEGEFEVLP